METTAPTQPFDTDGIGHELSGERQVTFGAQGFWLETKRETLGGHAYVDVSPLLEETAERILSGLRRWAA